MRHRSRRHKVLVTDGQRPPRHYRKVRSGIARQGDRNEPVRPLKAEHEAVLALLGPTPTQAREIAEALEISAEQCQRRLYTLAKRGLALKEPDGKGWTRG